MLSYLKPLAKAWFAEIRRRRELRSLLEKDDRLLRDMGLTRPDIEAALTKPLHVDAQAEATRLSILSLRLDRAI